MAGPYRQSVPRPPTAERIDPPSWSALSADARRRVPLESFVASAERVGARRGEAPGSVHAAVVLPVYALEGDTVLVLIRRAADLSADPGHVAMAGGHLEDGEGPLEAALREAHEEIGLDPRRIERVVSLGAYHRRIRSDDIAAFVGVLAGRPELAPSAGEVESVLEIPVGALLADGVAWEEHWGLAAGAERVIAFFGGAAELGDDLLWGLTARIVWELLEVAAAGLKR